MIPDTAQDSSFNLKFLCIILRKKRRHAYKINPNITCLVIYWHTNNSCHCQLSSFFLQHAEQSKIFKALTKIPQRHQFTPHVKGRDLHKDVRSNLWVWRIMTEKKSDYRKFTFDVTIKISADFWTRKLWYVLIHKHRQNIVLVDLDVAMFTKLNIFWDRLCKNNCKATSLIELFVQDNRYQDWFLSYINKRLSEFVVYNGHLLRMATLCW